MAAASCGAVVRARLAAERSKRLPFADGPHLDLSDAAPRMKKADPSQVLLIIDATGDHMACAAHAAGLLAGPTLSEMRAVRLDSARGDFDRCLATWFAKDRILAVVWVLGRLGGLPGLSLSSPDFKTNSPEVLFPMS